MKVILAIGNSEIEERVKLNEKIQSEINENLHELKDLLPHFFYVDYLVINKEMAEDSDILLDIAVAAQKKNIKIVILTDDFESSRAKREISLLAAEDVYAFMDIHQFDENRLLEVLENYPKEFDFNLLVTPDNKIVEKEKIVEKIVEKEVEKEVVKTIRNQVITCFSADNALTSAGVAAEVANLIANTTGLKVLLIDFNNINPVIADILGVDRYLKNTDIYEKIKKQTSLEALVNAIDRKTLNNEVFKQLIQRDKKYKFDIITGLYDLIFDDKVDGSHYKGIIDIAQKIYDVVVISTNPYIKDEATYYSLIGGTHILGITDNNYTGIYNLLANIKYINPQIIDKEIQIILANNSEYSLTEDKINELFEDYKRISIPFYCDNKMDESLNKSKLYTDIASNEIKLAYNNILINLGYKSKIEKKKKGLLALVRR